MKIGLERMIVNDSRCIGDRNVIVNASADGVILNAEAET